MISIYNFVKHILYIIINYGEKEIEFEGYDYPYNDNDFLDDYYIGNVHIIHKEKFIMFESEKKELIPCLGIFYYKGDSILPWDKIGLETVLGYDKEEISIDTNEPLEEIFKKVSIFHTDKYTFKIKSKSYDLRNEKGIIFYYNTNDMYERELIHRLLKKK